MLESVTYGRKVIIDPSSGNSYYKPVDTSATSTPLFNITPATSTPLFNITPATSTPLFNITPATSTPLFNITPATSTPLFNITPSKDNARTIPRLTLESQEQASAQKCYNIPKDTKYFSFQPLLTNVTKTAFWCRDDLSFSKSDIESVQLLNQVDRKFLCCILKVQGELILVLFDQHAVHERVRLEDLIADYRRHRAAKKEGSIPHSDLSALQSTACHGAIKFGDKLDRSASVSLLHSLTRCSLPFQCAHGRPSIAPLLNISKMRPSSEQYTVDRNKLKMLLTRIEIKHNA